MVEGAKVLSEAVASGRPVEGVYLGAGADAADRSVAESAGARVYELGPGVLERIAGTTTPQPLLAVVPYVDVGLDDLLPGASLIVVCVDVRDPGNAGTVLRTAEAAGAHGVVCCEGSVDVYNPKTVRASAGALFHVPVVAGGDAEEMLGRIGAAGISRLATVARGGRAYEGVDLTRPVAFVLGNEASGLPDTLGPAVDARVTIPMVGRSESLNVGMAAAVLCFEAARQRRAGAAAR